MTRYLTNQEIEYIIDFIKPQNGIPHDSAESIVKINKQKFRNQLKKQQVYPEIIPELKIQVEKAYIKSLVAPGESVGILCAQSIGEKQTQMLLNSFHKAGQSEKGMTAGVPRFEELLSATKTPKIVNCTIYLKNGKQDIKMIRELVGHNIVGFTLSNLTTSIQVVMDKKTEPWYHSFAILHSDLFKDYKNCISVKLNMDKLFEYKLTLKQIAEKIKSEYIDVECVFSPPHQCQIDIFINMDGVDMPENRISYIDTESAPLIYLEECVLPELKNMYICGIPGIEEIYYSKDQKTDEWIIETDGTNYKDLLAYKDIDFKRTVSNNVWDIYDTLGIEAARQSLIEEFTLIMEGINSCHTNLLVDRMTFSGTVSSISRYTLRREEAGPFCKASFEETLDNFLKSAAYGDIEPTKGVSSSIICGKRANIGTGMMDLRINIKQLPEAIPILEDEVRETVAQQIQNIYL